MGDIRRHFFKGWIPIHRIGVLANLYGGAGKFCTLVAGRRWSILLVRRDRLMQAVPVGDRPTLRNAIDEIDALAGQIITDHDTAYHPGRQCRENERGECVDRFGGPARPRQPLRYDPEEA